ncbi:MAG: hypothetical protein JO199_14375 [Candidatus Eremiobacteraeota bacterium]|nr:hypothetical protein [Candidatus Eremiobacteraeota bacterium]
MSADLLDSAAAGMDAQRVALDVAARNVAAAAAAGPNGNYPRLVPEFRVIDAKGAGSRVAFVKTRAERGTNVDMLVEMIAVMNASRAFDTDASLFDVGKTLAEKTIELGRL